MRLFLIVGSLALIACGVFLVVQQLPAQLRWGELGTDHQHYHLNNHYGLYNEIVVERDDPNSDHLDRTWYIAIPLNHNIATFIDTLAADYRDYDRIPASALPPLVDITDIRLIVRTKRFHWLGEVPPAVNLHLNTKNKLQGTIIRFSDLAPYEQHIIRSSFPQLNDPYVLFEGRWPAQWRWGFTLILIGLLALFGQMFHSLRSRNLI